MLEQFGISVAGLSHNLIYDINSLNVDIVQVPLHRGMPDEYVIDQLADTDTRICGKLVPDPKIHTPEFFKALFKRYKGRIKLWDFGGEPETRPHQPGCRWPGTAKEFQRLYNVFWNCAKEADPENIVGGGGFISPTFNGLFGNDSRFGFLEELFSEGFGSLADFFSLNVYVYGYGGEKNYIAGILKFRELLARHRCSFGIPLVIAEGGVPCAGDPRFLHIIQTPETQASSLVKFHLTVYSLGVDYSIWYTLRDPAWGIIDGNGTRRSSYLSFQTLVRLCKGAKYQRTMKAFPSVTVTERLLTDYISWHVLRLPNGNDLHIVWMAEGYGLPRYMPSGIIRACDMLGRSLEGSMFMLDEVPKYFEVKAGGLHSGNFLLS